MAGLLPVEEFDYGIMWSYAFMTFMVLSVGYAVLRVASRAMGNSEIKTRVTKKLKGMVGGADNEDRRTAREDRAALREQLNNDNENDAIKYLNIDSGKDLGPAFEESKRSAVEVEQGKSGKSYLRSFVGGGATLVGSGASLLKDNMPGISDIKNKLMGAPKVNY